MIEIINSSNDDNTNSFKRKTYSLVNEHKKVYMVGIIKAIIYCAIKKLGIEIVTTNTRTKNIIFKVNNFDVLIDSIQSLNTITYSEQNVKQHIKQSFRVWFGNVSNFSTINGSKINVQKKRFDTFNNAMNSVNDFLLV